MFASAVAALMIAVSSSTLEGQSPFSFSVSGGATVRGGATVGGDTSDVAGPLDGTVTGAAPPNASTHQIPVSSRYRPAHGSTLLRYGVSVSET